MPVKEPRPTKELVSSSNNNMMTSTKGTMEYPCTICGLLLDLPTFFTHSKEVHGVFSCLYCFRYFKFSKELMVHLTREHKVTPQKFASGAEFLDRGGTDTTLLCVECNKVFQSETLITFMKYHIHECRKSTGICPKCGSIHPLNLLGEHILHCQGSMNVNLHGSTTITTSQLRSRDNSCKYCGKKFSPSKIAAHMRACSVRSTKSTYNVWNSSSIIKHEALNHSGSNSGMSPSPKGQSLDTLLVLDDPHHSLKTTVTTTTVATTNSGLSTRRDSVSSSIGKVDGVIKNHAESLPLLSTTITKSSAPSTSRTRMKNQRCDSSLVSIPPMVPIKTVSGSKKSGTSSCNISKTFSPVTSSTHDDRKLSLQRKRQSSVSLSVTESPHKTTLSVLQDSSSISGKPVSKHKAPSVSVSPPKVIGRRNKVQLQFQSDLQPPKEEEQPPKSEVQEQEPEPQLEPRDKEDDAVKEEKTPFDTESVLVPKEEEVEEAEEEEEVEEEEEEEEVEGEKLDPLLMAENGDKRLSILISELSEKLEYFHRIFNEQQMQQQQLQLQQQNSVESATCDSVAANATNENLLKPPSYELIVNYSLNRRTDVGILNDMLVKSSVDCPYCKLVRLIRIDKRQLVIHMLSKHSWDLRVLRTPAMVLKSILDSRSSVYPIKTEESDIQVQQQDQIKKEEDDSSKLVSESLSDRSPAVSVDSSRPQTAHMENSKKANQVNQDQLRGDSGVSTEEGIARVESKLETEEPAIIKQEAILSESSETLKDTAVVPPVVVSSSPSLGLPLEAGHGDSEVKCSANEHSPASELTQVDEDGLSISKPVLDNASASNEFQPEERDTHVQSMDVDEDMALETKSPVTPSQRDQMVVATTASESVKGEEGEGKDAKVKETEGKNANSVALGVKGSETQIVPLVSELKSVDSEREVESQSSVLSRSISLVNSSGEEQGLDPDYDETPLDLDWTSFKLALLDKVFRSQNIVYTFSGEKLPEFGEIPCECLICGFIAESQKNLFPHWRRTHRGVAMKCTMCKGRFLFAGALYSHLCLGALEPLALKEKELEDEDGDSEETVGLKYQCSICEDEQMPGFFNYMVHLRKDHNKCELCLETLPTQKELEHHMKKHKLNHFCWKCNLSYCAKPNFMTHLFWKHGTESVDCSKCLKKKWPHIYHFCVPPEYFSCDVCGLYFTKPKALIVHKRLHTGEKLRRCPKTSCQERFISKKLLQKHLDTVHVKIPPVPPPILPPPPALSPPPEEEEKTVGQPAQDECPTKPCTDSSTTDASTTATTDGGTSESSNIHENQDNENVRVHPTNDDVETKKPSGSADLNGHDTGVMVPAKSEHMDVESTVSKNQDSTVPKNGNIFMRDASIASGVVGETQRESESCESKPELNGEQTPMDIDDAERNEITDPVNASVSSSPRAGGDKVNDGQFSLGNEQASPSIKLTIQTKSITDDRRGYKSPMENFEDTDIDLSNSNFNNPSPVPKKFKSEPEEPPAKPFNLAEIQGPNLSEDESDSDEEDVGKGTAVSSSMGLRDDRGLAAGSGNARLELDSLCNNHNGSQEPVMGSLFSSPPLKKDDIPSANSSPRISLDTMDLHLVLGTGTGETSSGNLLSTPAMNSSSKNMESSMDIYDAVNQMDMTDSLSTVGVLPSLDLTVSSSTLLDNGDKLKNGDDFGSMSPLLPPLDDFDFSVPEIPTFEENHLPEHIIQENALFSIQHEHDYCSPMFNNTVGGKRKVLSPAANFGPGHLFHAHAARPSGEELNTTSKSPSRSKPKKIKVRKPSPKKSTPKKRRRSRSSSSSSSSSSSCSSCGSNCSCSSSSSGSSSSSSSDDSDSEPSGSDSVDSISQKNTKLTKQTTKVIPKIKTVLPPPSPKKDPVTVKIVNNGKLPKPKKEKPPKPPKPATTRKYKRTKVAKMTLKLGKTGGAVIGGGATAENVEETPIPEPEPDPEPYIMESDLETDDSGSEDVFHKKQLTEVIGAVQLPDAAIWVMGNEKYLLKIVRGIEDVEDLRPPPPPPPPTPPPPPPKAKKERVKYSVKNGGNTESKLKVRNVPIKPLIVKRNVNSGGNLKSEVTVGNCSVIGESTFQTSLSSNSKHNTITVSRGPPNAATSPPVSSLVKGAKGSQRGKTNHSQLGGKTEGSLDGLANLPSSVAEESTLSPAGNKRAPRGRKSVGRADKAGGTAVAKQGKAAKAAEAYDEKLYCFCQSPHDYVSQMIGCDGKDCQYKWFHFECVGIFIPPKGKWFCSECREARRQKAREKLQSKQKEKQQELLLLREHGPE